MGRIIGKSVCIIVATNGNTENLKKTVASILENTRDVLDYRILIVSNGELQDIFNHPKISIYWSKFSSSIKAFNVGIQSTRYDEDIFLTHDDVLIPYNKMDWLLEMYRRSGEEDTGVVTTINGVGISGKEYLKDLLWCGTWAMYIPRKTLLTIGSFDENMKIGEDIDYAYRLKLAGLKIKQIPFYVIHHQKRETPHADQSENIIKEASEYFRKKWNLYSS